MMMKKVLAGGTRRVKILDRKYYQQVLTYDCDQHGHSSSGLLGVLGAFQMADLNPVH
jgi:hypothetical protein